MYKNFFLIVLLYSYPRVHAMEEGVEKVVLPGQLRENNKELYSEYGLEHYSAAELDKLLDDLRPTVLQDPDMKSAYETFGDVGILALTDMMNAEKVKVEEICKQKEELQSSFKILVSNRKNEATISRYTTRICDYYWGQMSTLINKKTYKMLAYTISKNYLDLMAYFRALKKISVEDANEKLYWLGDVYKERERDYTIWRERVLQEQAENILKQEQERFTRGVQSTSCQPEPLEVTHNKLSLYYTKFLQHVRNPDVENCIKRRMLENCYDIAYWFYVHNDVMKALSYTYVGSTLSRHWEYVDSALESNLQRFKGMLEGTPSYARKTVNTARWPFRKRGMQLERKHEKRIRFTTLQ